ncbi:MULTISPECIES: acyl-CoA carboxylase subunit epsilon [unclassified Nocardia]|uniref:acyl-CoA carboxylase subunit epsilon n=1 Tax=unclassified Nocardia TaxID=2637762 RepID=UPI0024A8C295|nr:MULTISPECIES: acyl-CoA carboxylase subunit epsilon [unclassified Nocardia]
MSAPDIVITRGNPDDAEIAALVAVFAVLAAGGTATDRPARQRHSNAWRRSRGSGYHKAPAAWAVAARIHPHPVRIARRAEEQR